MTRTFWCKHDDITFEGEQDPGSAYGPPCKICGRYSQPVSTHTVHRSAVTGRFVDEQEAERKPKQSVAETVTTKPRRKR